MRLQAGRGGAQAALFFQNNMDDAVRKDLEFVRRTMGLDPSVNEYNVVYRHAP